MFKGDLDYFKLSYTDLLFFLWEGRPLLLKEKKNPDNTTTKHSLSFKTTKLPKLRVSKLKLNTYELNKKKMISLSKYYY